MAGSQIWPGLSAAELTAAWPPFGLPKPSDASAADATIAGNTNLSGPIHIYRNLTINNGIVLSVDPTYGIALVVCETLALGNTSSQVSADGAGGTGGAGRSTDGVGNAGTTRETIASGTWLEAFQSGLGAASFGAASPGAAARANTYAAALMMALKQLAPLYGGGGGGGALNLTGVARTGGASGGGLTQGGNGGPTDTASAAGAGTSGSGGAGGGILIVVARDVTGAAGIVSADGIDGTNSDTSDGGGGGGGGGGVCVLITQGPPTVSPTVSANGGAAGTSPAGSGTGEDGEAGGAGIALALEAG